MKRFALTLLLAATTCGFGQSVPSPGETSHTVSPPPDASATKPAKTAKANSPAPSSSNSTASLQTTIDRLAQSNAELLDLLKKQQAVLEDIQYDRRLQNRQIQLIEVRLEDTLQLNATLQAKIARLETAAAAAPASSATPAPATATAATNQTPASEPVALTTPPPPSSFLPPPESEGMPGTMSWHRVLALSGEDAKTSDTFHIQGRQWRVLWHNQDRPGDIYKNTSALFISAFPKNDNIPKKVCSKLGSGGDSTELTGTGDFYLKIEASGGRWELAVEDFR